MKQHTTYTSNNHYIGKIRIIGGKWRGKKITVTKHPQLRPTSNQIRETLFNWLTPIISESNCLDCFAGSGALGLEALSRHANQVTFLEQNKTISKKLKKVIQILNIQKQAKVITTDSNQWLANLKIHQIQPYNIIFLDPPFRKWYYMKHTIQLLEKCQYLSQNIWIYIENQNTNTNLESIIPNHWKLHKKKIQKTSLINSTLKN